MNYTDLYHCLGVLRQRPKWFRKDTTQAKLRCLDTIHSAGDPHLIYSLFEFLKSNQPLIRQKTAEIIIDFFGKLKSRNAYEQSLKHLSISRPDLSFFQGSFDEKTYLYLLQIASLNHSGYVRQKAVELLGKHKSPEAVKFILFRLGDWVPQVSAAAETALRPFISVIYLDELLAQLPVIESLLKIERLNLTAIHSNISFFIIGQADFNTIQKQSDGIRLLYYKHLSRQTSIKKEHARQMLSDRYFLIRRELLKHISIFDNAFQKELITAFLKDPSAGIRIGALRATQTHGTAFDTIIDQLLSDKSAAVRELCRYLLKPAGIDYAELYRARITSKMSLIGSVAGLTETGGPADVPVFEQHIHSDKSSLIAASLVAIHKFDPDKAKEYALTLITHAVKRVRNKSSEVLAKSCDIGTLNRIRSIYAAGNEGTKQHILRFYSKLGGWDVVSDLLTALPDNNMTIRECAWEILDKWETNSTRLFTSPSLSTSENVKKLLENLHTDILTISPRRVKILKSLQFIFR